MVEKAVGGVLFIDEAYSSPVPGQTTTARISVLKPIAELIQQMENRRNNLVVIFAGYTDRDERCS